MANIIRHTDVLGGVVGGFLPNAPFLGWRHYSILATYEDPQSVEFPVIWIQQTKGPTADTVGQVLTRLQSGLVDRQWPMGDGALKGSYPAFAWYFMDPSTLAFVAGPCLPVGDAAALNQPNVLQNTSPNTVHFVQWFEMTPPTGPYIAVLVSREPSPEFPVFAFGHPVELITERMTAKSESYDSTSATDVTTELYPKLRHVMPITSTEESTQTLIDRLGENYGFQVRRSATTGDSEFFVWREKLAGNPAATIGINDVRAEGGPTFKLSDSSRVNRVKFSAQVLSTWEPGTVMVPEFKQRKVLGIPVSGGSVKWVAKPALLGPDKPASGIMITTHELTYDYSTDGVTLDADIYGEQVVEVDLGGVPALADTGHGGYLPLNLSQWCEGYARLLFDKHARGRQMATVPLLRGQLTPEPQIGDAITLDLPHLPNAQLGQSPTSQRGGERPFRVLSSTPELAGPLLYCADEGTGVPLAIDVTLRVIAELATTGNQVFRLEVNPAEDLATDKAQIEFQVLAFAVGESIDLSDPGLRYTVIDSSAWAETGSDPHIIRLGDFPPEHQVRFRARAFKVGGAAGAWSAWYGTGGTITGPQTTLSDLVIDQITDEGARLTWSYDESPQVGDVLVQFRDVTTLIGPWTDVTGAPFAPGTETVTLTGRTVGHVYEVRVVLVDGALVEYGDVLLGSFTTTGGKISSLVITSPSSDGAKLAWTNTDGTRLVLIEYRVDLTTTWQTFAFLPATSNRIRLTGLTPSTDYNVQVSLAAPFAPPFTGGLPVGDGAGGPALTDDFSTLATSVTLEVPLIGGAFWDWDPYTAQRHDGRFGVRLQANSNNIGVAHQIIVLLAEETAVASATPGTYVEQAPITATPGVDLWFVADAPPDGKLRYMKAISRANGYNDSSETIVFEARPWSPTGPQPPTGGGITNTYDVSATALGSGSHSTGSFFLPDGAEIFRLDSPLSKDIRIRLYTNSTDRDNDTGRASNDSNWPQGIIFDAEILTADSHSISISATQQRPKIIHANHESQLVWYTLTNLEAGAEDVSCRIFYFAAPTGSPGPLA